MSLNGSGVMLINSTGQPVVANTLISAAVFNAFANDVAAALSTAVYKDGQQTITANIPMGTFRHTGVGNGAARNDYAATGQVQDGKLNWVDGGGTADAITATYSPAITELVDGQECCVRATAANATTTPTFSPSGLTARTIVKAGGGALIAGNIAGDGHELILRYDLANTRWELMNPNVSAATQAQQETGTSTVAYVSPGTQHFHPSAAKASCLAKTDGTNAYAYNCDSPTDSGVGDITINFTTDFSTDTFAVCASILNANTTFAKPNSISVGTARIFCLTLAGDLADPTVGYSVIAHGDQ